MENACRLWGLAFVKLEVVQVTPEVDLSFLFTPRCYMVPTVVLHAPTRSLCSRR